MDTFWGIGENRQGSNQFGVVLMELRENFVNKKAEPPKLPEPLKEIEFYHNTGLPGDHYNFTNFADVPVHFAGKVWKTAEHLFQAWKVCHSPFLIGTISKHLFNSSRMTAYMQPVYTTLMV